MNQRKKNSAKGGGARSRKKIQACRQNARQKRPGRSAFFHAVRVVAAAFEEAGKTLPKKQAIAGIIKLFHKPEFPCNERRAGKIYDMAVKRL